MTDEDYWTRFWETICEYENLLKFAVALPVFLLVLQLLALPAIPRDSASFTIMTLNFAILVPLLGFLLYLVVRCRNREPTEQF